MQEETRPRENPRSEGIEPALRELQVRLEQDLSRLLEPIQKCSQAQLDWHQSGRWSIGEVLHHLTLSNRLFAIVISRLLRRGKKENARWTGGARPAPPRLRLAADRRESGAVQSPARALPTAGIDREQLLSDFLASHTRIVDQIPGMDGLDWDALKAPHPLGFELNLVQWVEITGAHEARHTAQVHEIMSQPGFPAGSPGQA